MCLITTFLILCSPSISAQQSTLSFQNEDAARKSLASVDHGTLSPIETIDLARDYANLAKNNEWQTLFIEAQTEIIYAYVTLNDISKASTEFSKLQNTIDISQLTPQERILIYRNELDIQLGIADTERITFVIASMTDALSNLDIKKERVIFADSYMSIGQSYEFMNEYAKALEYYQLAYQSYKELDDEGGIGIILNSLANVHSATGSIEKAVEYYEASLAIDIKAENTFDESVTRYNLAKIYLETGNIDVAMQQIQDSIALSQNIGDEIGLAWSGQLLAEIYIAEERYEEAIVEIKSTLPTFEQAGDNEAYIYALYFMAKSQHALMRKTEALESVNNAIALISENRTDATKFEQLYYLRAKINQDLGQYEGIFDDLNKVIALSDKNFEQTQQSNLLRYREEFDTEIRERENDILRKQATLDELTIENQSEQQLLLIIFAIFCSIVLVLIGILLFQQIKLRRRFREMALQDPLTNLPNRRAILSILEAQWSAAIANNTLLSIALIDIDYFKKINDNFGHETGDKVLIEFGRISKEALRESDNIGRYGGEEWLLVMNNCKEEQLVTIFKRIRDNIEKTDFTDLPKSHQVTFSMGVVSLIPTKQQKVSELIHLADEQLYLAKNAGRDQLKSVKL